jgi:hypothetical protein
MLAKPFTLAIGWLVLMLPACHRWSEEERIDHERTFQDASLVCGRVHDGMRASEPGRIYADLPGVALLVERTYGISGPIEVCGDELLAWIQRAVEARPLDLRPRLVAQVTALAPFVSSERWHGRARDLLARLLLDASPRQIHWRQEWNYLGPGSQRVHAGFSAVVGVEELDREAALALARGHVTRSMDDGYADFLAQVYTQRFSDVQPQSVSPLRGPPASLMVPSLPPPAADRVGDGHGALDVLWPDLGRAFRREPTHPRWQRLPPTLRLRLSEQRPLILSPQQPSP